jgi:hypothetical protein
MPKRRRIIIIAGPNGTGFAQKVILLDRCGFAA